MEKTGLTWTVGHWEPSSPYPTPSPSKSGRDGLPESCLGSEVRDQNSAGFHILRFSFSNRQKEDGKQKSQQENTQNSH